MQTQLVDSLFADLLQVVRFLCVYLTLRQSFKGIDISSSTVVGLFTWPEMLNNFVPVFLGPLKC